MRKVILLIIVYFLCGCSGKNEYIIPEEYREGHFEKRQGTYDKKDIVIRINTGLEPIVGNKNLSFQVAVSVILKNTLENGLPDTTEQRWLLNMEHVLREKLVNSGLAVYALEVHTDGTGDFIFYTAKGKEVETVLNAIKVQFMDHKITITVKQDRKWVNYTWFSSWK